jgi:purine-nucleoside phosphorylase
MITAESVSKFQHQLTLSGAKDFPVCHVVLGSGFGMALDREIEGWQCLSEFSFENIPGLSTTHAPGHSGKFKLYQHKISQKTALFQLGRLHGYEGNTPAMAVAPVLLSKLSGIQSFLLTNAAGGLHPSYQVGDVMLIRDHVNLTGQNPLVGPNPTSPTGAPLGPRFPDMTTAYDSEWRKSLARNLTEKSVRVHEGLYIGLLGPSYETPAEISLFKSWGIDAVGMSTVWETIALKHAGARVAGLSLISNAAAGLGDGAPLKHEDVLEACREAAARIVRGVSSWIEKDLK